MTGCEAFPGTLCSSRRPGISRFLLVCESGTVAGETKSTMGKNIQELIDPLPRVPQPLAGSVIATHGVMERARQKSPKVCIRRGCRSHGHKELSCTRGQAYGGCQATATPGATYMYPNSRHGLRW